MEARCAANQRPFTESGASGCGSVSYSYFVGPRSSPREVLFSCGPVAEEEALVRLVFYHRIVARRDQQQRRRHDGGVLDHPRGGVEKLDQDARGDVLRDRAIGIVRRLLSGVAREPRPAHVALDRGVRLQLEHEPRRRQRAGHVELHLKGRRRQHEGRERRGVVVRPDRRDQPADAVRDDRHARPLDPVRRREVIHERLQVAHIRHEARSMAAATGRLAVPARLPREDRRLRQREVRHHRIPSVRMLVAAVQQDHRPRKPAGRRPSLVLQRLAIAGGERHPLARGEAHCRNRG
jgi:hypothetical protein